MQPSIVASGHPDFELLHHISKGVLELTGGIETIQARFPLLVQDAIEFVLDPVTTGRTEVHELDNVEKTFVGLKVEHFLRDLLDAPKGIRDLVISGHDVDVKNTLDNSWMIPPETYSREEICLVVNIKPDARLCWLGLLVARQAYLNAPNRDGKRGVKSGATENVYWIVENASYPPSRWEPFDMAQFRRLRSDIKGGTRRLSEFFRNNLEVPVHRKVIEALLYPASDYMKRARGNGGARDVLRKESIAILSGAFDNSKLAELDRPHIGSEELVAIKPRNPSEMFVMQEMNLIDRQTQ